MTDESYVGLHDDPNDDLENDDQLDPDSGDDSDLPAEDAGGDDEPLPDEPPVRAERGSGRASDTIRQLREERRAATERAAELEREVARYRQPAQPAVDPAEEDRRFLASIQELPYDQQLLAVRNRERQAVTAQFSGVRLELARTEDRIAFSDLKRENPIATRYASQVEEQFKTYQAAGQFVSREIILKNIIGDIALKNGGKVLARDAQRAAKNVNAQRGRGSARPSTAAPGGRADRESAEAVEARLRAAFEGGATLADI